METGLDGPGFLSDYGWASECDGSCSGMSLVGCRTISHEECDRELARRDLSYAFVLAQEKVRNYFTEAMKVYGSQYPAIVG